MNLLYVVWPFAAQTSKISTRVPLEALQHTECSPTTTRVQLEPAQSALTQAPPTSHQPAAISSHATF